MWAEIFLIVLVGTTAPLMHAERLCYVDDYQGVVSQGVVGEGVHTCLSVPYLNLCMVSEGTV